ncbi:DUF4301 family protein [Clostridia bacterium]|nr:DUF4301 family protein [Clostridia bacterium]
MDKYIEKFKRGTQYVNIVSAVTEKEITKVSTSSDDYLKYSCLKFIPASGAATRMFKDLYQYLDDEVETDFTARFFNDLEEFPFYRDIQKLIQDGKISKETVEGRTTIIRNILADGLNYGNLPKALIKIHSYDEGDVTPIDEHIYEAEEYLKGDTIGLHFTISKEYEELFNQYVEKAIEGKKHVNISYSFQKEETNTLAVDMKNKPFILENGEVLYRAGGHGALIENLNDLDADILFIKNIDNVCHRDYLGETIEAKKKLASIGLKTKERIDEYIQDILIDDYDMDEIESFIKESLNISNKKPFTKEGALALLNRPLRVCGMVRNQGEPGGGPFIVDNGEYLDLQICEKSEIDLEDKEKRQIMESSRYFNPVDLVCFVKDYKGDKFNLLDYVNEDRYFISEKSFKGRRLKALEYPGLWNGAMHHWNTLFVEVPLITFNPVKTVNDMLRDGHKGKGQTL